jgi:hypothetical protein
MQVTVEISDSIAAQAAARGMALEAYVRDLIATKAETAENELRRFGPGPYTPQEAARQIRELRKGCSLGELTIRELIDAGRKY